MNFILILILPIVVQLTPLLLLRHLCKREEVFNNFKATLLVTFVLTFISLLTIAFGMQISIYGMSLNRPEGKVGCATGAVVFLMTGVVFFVITCINGLTYSIQSYNRIKKN